MHADIKPQNVLIFRERSGKFNAKVIDFGASAQYLDDDHKIELCGSEAWAAPEYGAGAQQNQSEAIEADLFSLGLLYFWLFFEPYMLGSKPVPSRLQGIDCTPCEKAEAWLEKMKGDIRTCAEAFLEAEKMRTAQEQMLRVIFSSSLSDEPKNRKAEPFEDFLRMQDPTW